MGPGASVASTALSIFAMPYLSSHSYKSIMCNIGEVNERKVLALRNFRFLCHCQDPTLLVIASPPFCHSEPFAFVILSRRRRISPPLRVNSA